MSPSAPDPDVDLKYEVEVGDQGRVELVVPFAPGARVVVYVRREGDESIPDLRAAAESIPDLRAAAESSLGFWDNPLDDEDWNDA